MTQVQRVEEQQMIPAEDRRNVIATDASTLMDVITRVAGDPNIDIEKIERLFAMYERINAQRARAAYNAALANMQPELPQIDENGAIKNSSGQVQSTYALWEDINAAITPILSAHGFGLSFKVRNIHGGVAVTALLSHRDGHTEENGPFELGADTSGSKNAVQALGSSTSYGKRYTATTLLNISSRANSERDDGGQAGGARGQSAAMSAAVAAINLCDTLAELREWKAKHADAMVKSLPADEAGAIIRLVNSRVRKLKGEAAQ